MEAGLFPVVCGDVPQPLHQEQIMEIDVRILIVREQIIVHEIPDVQVLKRIHDFGLVVTISKIQEQIVDCRGTCHGALLLFRSR